MPVILIHLCFSVSDMIWQVGWGSALHGQDDLEPSGFRGVDSDVLRAIDVLKGIRRVRILCMEIEESETQES